MCCISVVVVVVVVVNKSEGFLEGPYFSCKFYIFWNLLGFLYRISVSRNNNNNNNNEKRTCMLIDIAIQGDRNVI
jgi:hypothetical protein